jgi:hypothetical protein
LEGYSSCCSCKCWITRLRRIEKEDTHKYHKTIDKKSHKALVQWEGYRQNSTINQALELRFPSVIQEDDIRYTPFGIMDNGMDDTSIPSDF